MTPDDGFALNLFASHGGIGRSHLEKLITPTVAEAHKPPRGVLAGTGPSGKENFMRFDGLFWCGASLGGRNHGRVQNQSTSLWFRALRMATLMSAFVSLGVHNEAQAQELYFPFTDDIPSPVPPESSRTTSALSSAAVKSSGVTAPSDRSIMTEFKFLSKRLFGLENFVGISVFDAVGSADAVRKAQRISALCERVDERYRSLGWRKSPCSAVPWTYDRVSEQGYPLIYWDFSGLRWGRGEPPPDESTLVLGGVHPDELTPINLAFRFAEALNVDPGLFAQHRVVVAPLVNPDGFFMFPARRTNANGIDLNRNFATRDWWTSAKAWWRQRRNSDPRHFPGQAPETEEGTRFQVELMNHFQPDKLVSIHAPLGFLDYDGPGDNKRQNLSNFEKKARDLAYIVSRNSNNYRVLDFAFYPGSLGNYAGNERHVPTVTLELSSTNPRFADKYWREFFPGLRAAVKYEFKRSVLARLENRSLQTQAGASTSLD